MKLLPISTAQDRLTRVWLIGSGLPFIILVVQSLFGKYSESVHEVWGWFVPTVGPTLGLIIGVVAARALIPEGGQSGSEQTVNGSFFGIAYWLSIFYLLVLVLTILLEPFSPEPFTGIKLYQLSSYWLSPIQGLVVAAVTVLFNSKHEGVRARKGK